MSKLTLDEAIKHCLEVADAQEEVIKSRKIYVEVKGLTPLDECRKIAAEYRQLAEWLEELRARRHYMEKICEVLAEQFDSPCNFSPIDEYMLKNGCCKDCCGGDILNAECWSRYLQTKIVGGSGNG